MTWDDDELEPKAKRPVGRPADSPFASVEVEEEFVRCGQAMLELYYKPEGPGTKLDFVFGPGHKLSKTRVWSYIFVYYHLEAQTLANNVQGFVNFVQLHFDMKVISERSSICDCVNMLNSLWVHLKHDNVMTGASGKAQKKYRAQYQFVIRRWKECMT